MLSSFFGFVQGFDYVFMAGPEHAVILQPLLPECCGFKYVPPRLAPYLILLINLWMQTITFIYMNSTSDQCTIILTKHRLRSTTNKRPIFHISSSIL